MEPNNCSATTVLRWAKRGCPVLGCPVDSPLAFERDQQKLVDTLICCDILELASRHSEAALFLVSEDDDMIPALVVAGSKGGQVCHIRTNPKKTRLYDSLLIRQNVKLVHW